ncbi:hypothetical protein W97_02531 [Coniosporium apollinis CBS 100218]|uniref:Uncharacterized protein n=1 Tax=Coniosporium apollinis (strain CBS 100218) TaxID=1168221 RepID=R7YNA9_CONA1|nr:uncharacterized protein W97_02531 [Coniosporium apollinis CBS 100218]EON63304.1 hypothetical protein W97_02531 [Coniosporium apollinis CBS 100218]
MSNEYLGLFCEKAATRANEALKEARQAAGDAVSENQLKITRLEAQVVDLTDDNTEKDIRIAELEYELIGLQEKHDRVEDRYLTLKRHMADEERNQKMAFKY